MEPLGEQRQPIHPFNTGLAQLTPLPGPEGAPRHSRVGNEGAPLFGNTPCEGGIGLELQQGGSRHLEGHFWEEGDVTRRQQLLSSVIHS